ncbi:winged helix-turn-helix domain-containing protein [Ferrimicrobium sp.]|uniref:helix-turn-helix transcriptional regulator n=1 Tax=Ferrimicrobium sp. TaxID=2926050 RepID=UPI0026247C64|nr:winged helix-turn-helix domain-containing protein [Ferrimicrobium sp.]
MDASMPDQRQWTFLSNHGHVLILIAQDPEIRGRDIANKVGITERATQAIIADLVNAGYVERERRGRRNYYQVNLELPLRHNVEASHTIGELLKVIGSL